MKKTLFILLTTLLVASCSTRKHKTRAHYSQRIGSDINTESGYASSDKNSEPESEKQERIVLYNAFITIVVKNPDSTNVRLMEIAKQYDGYVQVLGNKNSVIRVKAIHLNNAIADISKTGKIKYKTISGDDVTDQYVDYQIRLENAYSARKRYLELLAKAETVEAALKVEKELERLNGEISSIEGKLNQLKHLSDYSTITVKLDEKVKPGILGYIGIGLYKSVKWLFIRN